MDADIHSFFDSVDHEWLLRIVSHRIADRRILRLIRRWLRAGVVEGNEWKETDRDPARCAECGKAACSDL